MCGVAGIVGDARHPAPGHLIGICDAMVHRGPDDSGIYHPPDGACVLGSRRLAVIDLSCTGHMPMGTEDGRFWITYNGEIYNFRALRVELERRGRHFRSRTDTEVVLQLFAEYGPSCVERLDGMFAFAIWDQQERSLFLARDRFGIKPLYYACTPEGFVFASEVRAILASGLVERRADPQAVAGYLMLGAVPDDRTIVHGISSLPPACVATFREGRLSLRRYWDHARVLRQAPPLPEGEIEETVRSGLKAAVESQLVSDAPLGLFLSGGVDSTTLVALARAGGAARLRTVSITFDEQAFDEGPAARRVAQRFGTEHVECRVASDEVLANLDRVIGAMDQPSADAVNTYFVAKAAREAGLTVALSGLGADELFGGYPSFSTVPSVRRVYRAWDLLPASHSASVWLRDLPGVPYRMRKLVRWAGQGSSMHASYLTVRGLMPPAQVAQLLETDSVFDPLAYVCGVVPLDGLADPVAVSALEARLYMHNQLLRDTDAMSMAHSLEVRVPYLANEVVALAARCRSLLGGPPKGALLAARSRYFPLGLPEGRKHGFAFPFDAWLRGPLLPMAEASLGSVGLFSGREIRSLWSEFLARRRRWSQVWALVVLGRWLDQHGMAAA